MIRWNRKIKPEHQKVLNELMAMSGEPFPLKNYWAVNLKTGRKFLILTLPVEADQ